QAEDGIRDLIVTGVQTCALPIFEDLLAVLVEPLVAEVDVRVDHGPADPRPSTSVSLGTACRRASSSIRQNAFASLICPGLVQSRSEEHTSELQSRSELVCRLLLE